MIDDRNSVTVRHVHINNRFSESVPDYEDVKVREFIAKMILHNITIGFNGWMIFKIKQGVGYFE